MVYLPAHFAVIDKQVMLELIRDFPLGMLITAGSAGLTANHVPFLYEPPSAESESPERLIAHVARNNAVWRDHDPALGALVVFQSPDAYISPNWYVSKRTTHEVVPTWNYAVVHVSGPLVVHDDMRWIRGQAGKLTKLMEASQKIPWKMADAPRAYVDEQLQSIIGLEIPIASITGKFKASQNRSEADAAGAVDGLRKAGGSAEMYMADLIERVRLND